MNALLVLYAGDLSKEAFEPLAGGKNSLSLAIERARLFPGVGQIYLLAPLEGELPPVPEGVLVEQRREWTKKILLNSLADHGASAANGTLRYDFTYFAWADSPFLDPELAGKLAERHLRYAAEYSYADGWPYGLAPEILSPGTAAILAKIIGDDDGGPVGRDALFSVIQKDINAFDIETEISLVDLRCHRLNLCADSKRNLLLLRRFLDCGSGTVPDTAAVERIVAEKPEILRTLPAFYPVQVYGGCPQSCAYCPWAQNAQRRDYMESGSFESLLEKIIAFSGDAVIDLSLWGETSLHPQKMELIEMVLRCPELALVIETSGIGWKESELEAGAALAQKAASVKRKMPPLSWIVSLDAADPQRYKEVRGAGCAEANDCAKKLLSLFGKDAYVQAVRMAGAEDDIERFYRSWKEASSPAENAAQVIIQKYDDFCGLISRRQASDLSPVLRQPCWHLMRDMPILLDGTVPLCREYSAHTPITVSDASTSSASCILGNAFNEALDIIWERGQSRYHEQAAAKKYDSLCAGCDEYYTYNF